MDVARGGEQFGEGVRWADMALRTCPAPLIERHDVLMLDLDGVVYVGQTAVPGAAMALEKARAAGLRLAFVTNNASRTPEVVANHLSALGVPTRPDEVVTSGQAAARLLAERLPAGANVLVVGADALRREVEACGLRAVETADDGPVAVVQGYTPDTTWRHLAEAAAAIHAGALWIATNRDTTLPSARGPMPGNGALVNAVRAAVDVDPVVAGKPEPVLHQEAARRTEARQPLVIGDRLDTDIEGAARAGYDSMLVLTGVTTPSHLLVAAPVRRPAFIAADLEGLLAPHLSPTRDNDGSWRCGGWRVRESTGDGGSGYRLELEGQGDELDALRALCAAAWRHDDDERIAGGRHRVQTAENGGLGPLGVDASAPPRVTARGEQAFGVLRRWEL